MYKDTTEFNYRDMLLDETALDTGFWSKSFMVNGEKVLISISRDDSAEGNEFIVASNNPVHIIDKSDSLKAAIKLANQFIRNDLFGGKI